LRRGERGVPQESSPQKKKIFSPLAKARSEGVRGEKKKKRGGIYEPPGERGETKC